MAGRDVELDLIGHDHTGHATRSAANNLDQLKRKLHKFDVETLASLKRANAGLEASVATLKRRLDKSHRGFLRSGLQAGSSFVQGFIKTISGGMLGRGTIGAAAKLSPVATGAGILVGTQLASTVLSTAHAAILAGLPLVFGVSIAALPFVHLWKGATENLKNRPKLLSAIEKAQARVGAAEKRFNDASTKAGKKSALRAVEAAKANLAQKKAALEALGDAQATEKAVGKLKSKWKGFADFVSKPFKPAFVDTLKEVGSGLERLKKPFAALVAAIGPALKPLTKGVFDGIIGFVKALKPAMPGITAGLKEWGRQLPIIMTAFGDAFAAILKDPDKVQAAVRTIGDAVVWVADSLPGFVDGVKMLSNALKGLMGPIGLILPGFTAMTRGITTALWTMALTGINALTLLVQAMAVFNPAMRPVLAGLKVLGAAAQLTFDGIKNKWAATDAAVRKRKIVAAITARIDDLETKIVAAKAKLKTVHNKKARAKIEATIKDLEAKAAAAKRLLARVQGTRTVAKIKAEIKDLEAKIAAAKAKLKTVHNAKTQAKIRADISQLQAAAARARAELASIHGKTVTITTRNVRVGAPAGATAGRAVKAAGDGWAGAAGGSYRTGGPRVVLGDTNVDSRVFIDGRELRAMARSTVIDETRRNAHRARVGRR